MTLAELEKVNTEDLHKVGFKKLFHGDRRPFNRYYFNDVNVIWIIPGVSGIKVEPTTLIEAAIDISSHMRNGHSFQYVAELCNYDIHKRELIEFERKRAKIAIS